jgi:NitT/TauT family transport system substrate-binding protein
MNHDSQNKLTPLGVIVSLLMVLGLVGVGGYVLLNRKPTPNTPPIQIPRDANTPNATPASSPTPASPLTDLKLLTPEPVPSLAAPATYVMKDNVLDLELSEYAGYAGLIAANGGLEPNPGSIFAKKHGFQVRIKLAEDEGWNRLNAGQVGATATTADVMAVFGRQFSALVPMQIGFSRGATGIVVPTSIKRINDLKGKVVVSTQYTEGEFFLRFLAQEAGAPVVVLDDLAAAPNPEAINLVFAEDGEQAGAIFAAELKSPTPRLAGCVTWDPTTTDLVQESEGKARLLVTNRNLLVIADLLVVNRGFAEANPKVLAGLVDAALEGNRLVRDANPAALAAVGKAFGWDPARTTREMSKVHLSNLPENLAFFSGAIDMAGSFGGIYQSSVLAYGTTIINNPADGERFLALDPLKALEASGLYKSETIVIAPIKSDPTASRTGGLENDPLLSKDIRFLFEPNSAALDMAARANLDNLEAIRKLLQVSPGSFVVLRGHVDNTKVAEYRAAGGEPLVRKKALEAMELSKNRAGEVRKVLIEKYQIDPKRIETIGRGWEEPAGADMNKNRRVEVYWFTLE